VVSGNSSSPDFPGFPGSSGAGQAATNQMTYLARLTIADPTQVDLPCMALIAENGASFAEGPISAGQLITLRGLDFGPAAGQQMQLDVNGKIPTQLAGVQVTFDGVPAPLLYVQSQQINVQAPFEIASRTTTKVHVQYQGQSSNEASFSVAP